MEDVLWLIYFIGCFLAILPIAKMFSMHVSDGDKADTEHIVFGLVMAVCMCWFWPLIVLCVPFYYAVKHW